MTSSDLANGIAAFLKERKGQLAPAERAALLKSLITVEQFVFQDDVVGVEVLPEGTKEYPLVAYAERSTLEL